MTRADASLVAEFPVGFFLFHRRRFINYQLNRAHALGYAKVSELRAAAAKIRRPSDCVTLFTRLSGAAADEGRYRNAASYQRLAEFFTLPGSPGKVPAYMRYRELFDRGFTAAGIVRHDVPYRSTSLPAYFYPAQTESSAGTVLIHGGFDSLIEEFFGVWQRIAAAGFDVVAFDGPGQGGARALAGLTFDHDWEQPVGAVLDYFDVKSAALVGISMGGYWALRAAAFEPRIERVVSWPPVYDWLLRAPAPLRSAARSILRHRKFMNWSVRVRTRLVPTLKQVIDQALYLVDGDEPMDAVDWFLGMNPAHLQSGRVTQDVLILFGENDSFQPPRLAHAQIAALTAARSVTTRMFSAAECADQHCQMGNLDPACDVLTKWLKSRWSLGRPRDE